MTETRAQRTTRRKEERQRAKRIKRIQRDKRMSDVHMTVVNASHEGNDIMSLSYELQLTNSALLYADQVTLVSPRAALIKNAQQINGLDGLALLKVFRDVAPKYFPDDLDNLDRLVAHFESGDGKEQIGDLEQQLRTIRAKMQDNLDGIFADSGYGQLQDALAAGILVIDEVDGAVIDRLAADDDNEMVMGFVRKIDDVLTDGDRYPLFDARAGEIVRLGVEANFFSPVPMARKLGSDAAMVSGLFDRLPNFQYATTPEILDIRTELSSSLTAFRQGVRSLTEGITLAPEDPDFSHEISDSWKTKVVPAIQEIEAVVSENSGMTDLLKRTLKDPIGGAAISAGAALPATLAVAAGPIGALIGVAGFVVGGSVALGRSLIDEHQEIESQKKAQFYFLYGTNQQLDPFRL